jgi:hypothetical protein
MERALKVGKVYYSTPSKYDGLMMKTPSADRFKAAKKKERSG